MNLPKMNIVIPIQLILQAFFKNFEWKKNRIRGSVLFCWGEDKLLINP